MHKVVLVSLILVATSWAQFSGVKNLNSADVIFIGETAAEMAGYHASIIGDVNDDGYDDILIGAPFHDYRGLYDNGKVYLIFGKSSGWNKTTYLSNSDASFLGEASSQQASHDVFGIKDVNGDGIDDFAIGVKFVDIYVDGELAKYVGKTYVFFGKKTGWQNDVTLANADAWFLGESHASEAAHVFPLGDVNGDGYNDIIIGAGFNRDMGLDAGKGYLIFGKATKDWEKENYLQDADASFLAEQQGDWFAHRVAGVGDINGDGLTDFIAGANGRDINGIADRGITYLFFGKRTGWARNVSASTAPCTFLGPEIAGIGIGWNVMPAGDVNGDGFPDILIGGQGKSRIYLVLGKSSGWTKNMWIEEVAATIFSGETQDDHAGEDMRPLGDINKDGFDDFIIGASRNDQNGKDAGKAYLFYGRASWPKNINLANADAAFLGETANDWAGWTAAGGGDVNGDGVNDLLIGGHKSDSNGQDAGKVYLFFTPKPPVTELTTPVITNIVKKNARQVTLSWASVQDATAYNVYRNTTPFFEPDKAGGSNRIATRINDQDANQPDVQWSDPATVLGDPENNYYYRITAVNGDTESAPSDQLAEFDFYLETTETTDFNTIALPLILENVNNAQQLMQAIPTCNSVARWDAELQGYEQYIPGLEFTNFPIQQGYPYYVNVTQDTVFTLVGKLANPNFQLITTSSTDFNEVMLTLEKSEITSASALMADIPHCDSVARWVAAIQGYEQYVPGLEFTDFAVKIGYPYYVNVMQNTSWPTTGLSKGIVSQKSRIISLGGGNVPHVVKGRINGLDLSRGAFKVRAWIESRPGEVLTEQSSGFLHDHCEWIFQIGQLSSAWRPGEAFTLIFYDSNDAVLALKTITLSSNAFDDAGELTAVSSESPEDLALLYNYPNPFNPDTMINFQIANAGRVSITVFNSLGQHVAAVLDADMEAGSHQIRWNATDDRGQQVPNGVYLIVLKQNQQHRQTKAILIR